MREKKVKIVVESQNYTQTMQNIKQIQKMYIISTFSPYIKAHTQARVSKNAYSGGRRAYALMRAGASERVEILS